MRRAAWPSRAFVSSVPVICVGNLVLGGAGKTPTALEVASVCRKLGLRPGFLTRGYGGSGERPDLVVSPAIHSAARCRRRGAAARPQFAPTVVAVDRPSGAQAARQPRRRRRRDGRRLSEPVARTRTCRWSSSTRRAAPATASSSRPARCARRSPRRSAAPTRWSCSARGRAARACGIAARAGLPDPARRTPSRCARRGLKRRPTWPSPASPSRQKFYAIARRGGRRGRRAR